MSATFISVALTVGVNLKWLAEYCGTSVAMIESRYGRYLERDSKRELQLLIGTGATLGSRKRATFGSGSPVLASNSLKDIASPTGFEPAQTDNAAKPVSPSNNENSSEISTAPPEKERPETSRK